MVDEPREEIRGDAELAPLRVEGGRWLRTSELGALLKERLQTLGNPLAFFEEIGNALSQVTGGDKSASAVNLSSSNIVTAILSVLNVKGLLALNDNKPIQDPTSPAGGLHPRGRGIDQNQQINPMQSNFFAQLLTGHTCKGFHCTHQA